MEIIINILDELFKLEHWKVIKKEYPVINCTYVYYIYKYIKTDRNDYIYVYSTVSKYVKQTL